LKNRLRELYGRASPETSSHAKGAVNKANVTLLVLVWYLLLAAGCEFVLRGPLRALWPAGDFNDFLSPYVQTRIWMAGGDPYDATALVDHWPEDISKPEFVKREALDGSLALRHGVPSPYPITAFPLLVPLAVLPWKTANLCWLSLEILSFLVLVAALLRMSRSYLPELEGCGLVLAILLLAPIHTAIAVENAVIVALALSTAAIVLREKQYTLAAAASLACATALKPTIALPFFIFFALRKHWGTLAYTAAGCGAIFLAAEIRMLASGTNWLPSFLSISQRMFLPGGVNDFSNANPIRFDLLNLQVVMSQVAATPRMAQYLSVGLALITLLIWLSLRQRSADQPMLLDLAILSVIALLPVYHRFYDAALLIFPTAWAVFELRSTVARHARVCLAMTVPFFLPGAAVLKGLAHSNATVETLAQSWWWNLFIAPHQVWLIASMLVTLLMAQRKLVSRELRIAAATPAAEAA
jgi:hypothetical protein